MAPEVLRELKECYRETDRFSEGWLTLTKHMLHKVSLIPGAVNIVVSACQLTPTLAKAMVRAFRRRPAPSPPPELAQRRSSWLACGSQRERVRTNCHRSTSSTVTCRSITSTQAHR